MKITKNFTIEELLVTSTGVANVPSDLEIENLKALCVNVLQPLRDLYGKPIIVTSGYRSPKVNKAVGGVPTSQHSFGEAVDITGGNRTINKLLYDMVVEHFEFDQIINEYNYQWIHISYTKRRPNRKQELKIG